MEQIFSFLWRPYLTREAKQFWQNCLPWKSIPFALKHKGATLSCFLEVWRKPLLFENEKKKVEKNTSYRRQQLQEKAWAGYKHLEPANYPDLIIWQAVPFLSPTTLVTLWLIIISPSSSGSKVRKANYSAHVTLKTIRFSGWLVDKLSCTKRIPFFFIKFAISEASDQPVYLCSPIKIFAVCIRLPWALT